MATNLRTVICLLRNDLRFHDNEVLHWANRNSTHILPLYCFDPKQFLGTPNFNFPMTGPFQMKLLLQTVADLRSTLRSKGSDLIVRHGKPEVVINDLIKTLGADNVHAVSFHEEVTRDEPLEVTLRKESQIKVQTFWGHTLYHKDDLSFSPKQLPDVYTQFRKKVEGQSSVRKCLVMPEKLNPLPGNIESGDIPSAEQLGGQECSFDERGVLEFRGGESVALERLNHYLFDSDNVATYKETRNGLIGADYSTKFSIWLAFGSLSPRHIFWEVKRYESERVANQSTYWVIFELIWRDYFRFVALKYGDQIFKLEGIHGKNIPWKQDQALFTAWKEGRTGVPFVDANMRELAATGFMSNRGRQNVASFLTKDLKLDWRMGAEWFESMLVDHDISSNYGNWLYSAGIGNDPREDRKFNMVKQGLDYDPNGDYIRLWIPELANVKGGAVHTVWTLSNSVLRNAGISLGETYPNPIVIAPEWQRHIGKTTGSARGGRNSGGSQPRQNRGIDFYFKGQGSDKHH